MSDRTLLAIGKNNLSVPRVVKRCVQVILAMAITALVVLALVMVNSILMPRGGWLQGLNTWLAFIKRSDILGTMALTALVTLMYLSWERSREKR
jgi:hypothetical protein